MKIPFFMHVFMYPWNLLLSLLFIFKYFKWGTSNKRTQILTKGNDKGIKRYCVWAYIEGLYSDVHEFWVQN